MADKVRNARTERRFFVDNTIIDDYGLELGPYGIAIYATLCRFANKDKQDCFPSHGTLAGRCGMSERQVIRKLKQLRALGLIRWEPCFRESGSQTSNLYTLLDPPAKGGVTVSQGGGDCESDKQSSSEQSLHESPAQAQNETSVPSQPQPPQPEAKGAKELERFFGPRPSSSPAQLDIRPRPEPTSTTSLFPRGARRTADQIIKDNRDASARGWARRSHPWWTTPELEKAISRYGDSAPHIRYLGERFQSEFGLAPDWSNKRQVKSWVTGLHELWVAAGENNDIAIQAGKRLREQNCTISTPRSLVNTARAIVGERATARQPQAAKEYV